MARIKSDFNVKAGYSSGKHMHKGTDFGKIDVRAHIIEDKQRFIEEGRKAALEEILKVLAERDGSLIVYTTYKNEAVVVGRGNAPDVSLSDLLLGKLEEKDWQDPIIIFDETEEEPEQQSSGWYQDAAGKLYELNDGVWVGNKPEEGVELELLGVEEDE